MWLKDLIKHAMAFRKKYKMREDEPNSHWSHSGEIKTNIERRLDTMGLTGKGVRATAD